MKRFKDFNNIKRLRTFLPIPSKDIWNEKYLAWNILFHILPKLRCLMSLSLRGYAIFKLSSEIDDLKHLQYPDFSRTRIQVLLETKVHFTV